MLHSSTSSSSRRAGACSSRPSARLGGSTGRRRALGGGSGRPSSPRTSAPRARGSRPWPKPRSPSRPRTARGHWG
eukprot:1616017-Alexandrium_andersonii.AAC.1